MLKKILPVLTVVLIVSCGNDDNGNVQVMPPRLLADQVVEDDAAIQDYLATHFYELVTDEAIGGQKVVIGAIEGENAGKTPMADNVKTLAINVSSNQIGLAVEENDIPHTLYYIIAREGAENGLQPTVADSTLFKYEGSLLNRTKFDAVSDFIWRELPIFVRGFANGVAQLKSGTPEGLVQNGDGTSYYTDSGIGIIIMPSGLAYFLSTGPSGTIPAYSPLVFTVEVGNVIENTDTDNDGIPSIMEDLNGNGYLFDDNTDEQSEIDARLPARTPNFRDSDDDDDGVATRTEISDAEGNIILPYPGSENGGTADYLNPDVRRDPTDN